MSGKLHPKDMDAALAALERSRVELPTGPIRPQTICQRGQVDKAFEQARDVLANEMPAVRQALEEGATEFRGLMALLAGCELALVDLGVGLSMHSPSAKDFNMHKAKTALETALNDFRRSAAP